MASGVDELLDMLYSMLDEAKSMPLSSDKCIIERDRALDLLDDIRGQFPCFGIEVLQPAVFGINDVDPCVLIVQNRLHIRRIVQGLFVLTLFQQEHGKHL